MAFSWSCGRVILSLNDLPEVRDGFAGMQLTEVSTTYSIAAGVAQGGWKELLNSNMRLPSAWAGA
jgi:hypothetical protein